MLSIELNAIVEHATNARGSMQEFVGSPGTPSGLVLRLGQSLFAAASVFFIAGDASSLRFTTFYYLAAAMTLQFVWSIMLAVVDIYALLVRRGLQKPLIVSLFVVGDWVTGTLSLAAASSTAGLIILLNVDTDYCKSPVTCWRYQASDTMAFISWALVSTSSLIILWILASG